MSSFRLALITVASCCSPFLCQAPVRFAVMAGGCNTTATDPSTGREVVLPGNCVDPMMRRWADEWSRTSGRPVEIDVVPFNEFESVLLDDWSGEAPTYHGYLGNLPSYIADYAPTGDLADLSPFIAEDDGRLMWTDVLPFFREFINTYAGKVYTIMFDGDVHSLFYREDLLSQRAWEVPLTIDELIYQASKLHGTDMNGDGEADYGFCLGFGMNFGYDTSYYESIIAPFIQTKGTAQGFFFDPDTLEPLVDSEGFVAGILKLRELLEFGTDYDFMAATENWEPTMRNLFMSGRCAFTLDWGGLQRSIFQSDLPMVKYFPNTTRPYAAEFIRTSYFPGTSTVYDMATRTMRECDRELCPYAIPHNGKLVNLAPLNAFCGFSVSLNGHQPIEEQSAAFDFVAFWNNPEQSSQDVVNAQSWFEPFRTSQFWPFLWLDAGMSEQQVRHYTIEMQRNLEFPNLAAELRIKGAPRYQEHFSMWVDKMLGSEFPSGSYSSRNYTGSRISADEYKEGIRAAFQEITAQYDFETQLNEYRLLLGQSALDDSMEGQIGWDPKVVLQVLGTVMGVFLILVLAFATYKFIRNHKKALLAAKKQRKTTVDRLVRSIEDVARLVYPMALVPAKDFLKHGRFHSHEVVRRFGQLIMLDTYEEVLAFLADKVIVFVSHQWLSSNEPDPDGRQYQALVDAVAKLCEKQFLNISEVHLWIDYSSIPQANRTLQGLAIRSLSVYASVSTYFIILAPPAPHRVSGVMCDVSTYQRRGWCRLEQLARVLFANPESMWLYTEDLECLGQQQEFFHDAIHVFQGEFSFERDKFAIADVILGLYAHAIHHDRDIHDQSLHTHGDLKSQILTTIRHKKKTVFPVEYFDDMRQIMELEVLDKDNKECAMKIQSSITQSRSVTTFNSRARTASQAKGMSEGKEGNEWRNAIHENAPMFTPFNATARKGVQEVGVDMISLGMAALPEEEFQVLSESNELPTVKRTNQILWRL